MLHFSLPNTIIFLKNCNKFPRFVKKGGQIRILIQFEKEKSEFDVITDDCIC